MELNKQVIVACACAAAAMVLGLAWAVSPLAGALLTLAPLFGLLCLRPTWGMYPLLLAMPMGNITFLYSGIPENFGEIEIPISAIPAALTLAGFLVHRTTMPRDIKPPRVPLGPIYLICLTLFLFAVCSLHWSAYPAVGVTTLITLAICFACFVLTIHLPGDRDGLAALLRFMPLVGVCVGIQVFLCAEWPDFRWSYDITETVSFSYRLIPGIGEAMRRPGGVANPNWTANILMTFLFLTAMSTVHSRLRHRLWAIVAFAFILIAQVDTASRMGMLVTLMGFCGWVATMRETRPFAIRLSVVMLFVLVACVLVFAQGMADRLSDAATGEDEAMLSTRFTMWSTGFHDLVLNLGRGIGVGAFRCGKFPYAHNVYFGILFDYGYLGAFLGILFIALCAFRIVPAVFHLEDERLRKWGLALFFVLMAMGLHALLDLVIAYPPFWVALGFLFNILGQGRPAGVALPAAPPLLATPVEAR